jgi:hypothetical protein
LLGTAEDTDTESASEDHTSSSHPTKKCIAKTAGGQIPKGQDFWGQVNLYFKREIGLKGQNLAGSQWKECISDFSIMKLETHIESSYVNKLT